MKLSRVVCRLFGHDEFWTSHTYTPVPGSKASARRGFVLVMNCKRCGLQKEIAVVCSEDFASLERATRAASRLALRAPGGPPEGLPTCRLNVNRIRGHSPRVRYLPDTDRYLVGLDAPGAVIWLYIDAEQAEGFFDNLADGWASARKEANDGGT